LLENQRLSVNKLAGKILMDKFLTRIFIVSFLLVFLSGCATTPTKKEARPTVFYPPLPNPPRIQYLASFSSAGDLGVRRSGFAEFVAGKDPKEKLAVNKPYGVAISDGKIYVTDTRGPGYAVFDLKNKKLKGISGSGSGRMKLPTNIAIDKDGMKYVTDTGLNQVLAFDKDDNFIRAYGVKGQFKPGDVAVSGNRLYVSDLKNHEIQVLDKLSGKLLFKFGKAGKKEGDLYYPTNMVIGPDNYLYISEIGNFRIQKFTLDGKPVRIYGEVGDRPGQFARPKGIAVDREGNIYAVDAAFENIQVFNQEGRVLLFFGQPGSNPEDINLPTTVVIDYENAALFQQYADPKFKLEYVILVASQFGRSKVNVFGFGRMEGMDYTVKEQPAKEKK
jgi:DNA-binding beta-propeller fold protein YncE